MKTIYLAQRRKACPGPRSGDPKIGVCSSSEVIFLAPLRLGAKIFLRVNDFVALTKPEITFLVLLATAVGSIMASASVNPVSLFHALFGTALVASGEAAL